MLWYCIGVVILSICSECANILYVVPFTSRSHYIMLKPIGLELAKRGHNVTVITGHKTDVNLTNYHQVMVDDKEIWELTGMKRPNVFTMVDISAEEFHDIILWRGGLGHTEVTLQSPQVKHFLANDNKFDLVISEQFFQEAMFTLAHKYNAPLVLITTYGNCMRHNIVSRNPLQLATVVSEFLDVKDPTSFWGRLRNLYFTVYEYVWWKYWYLEKQEEFVRKYLPNLPQPVPSLYELQRNAALILINSHFSFDGPVAYLPNIVEVGGLHLTRSTSKLPQDLQKLLDESKHGVVYVNFGSNVRSSEMPPEKKLAFVKIFSELKQTVFWKWEDDNFDIKTNNVVIRKWFPQKDVLSHPNVKVFISHGGLIGTQEAIFHGVPIIGVPIYADQYNNLLQAQKLGFGKILQYRDINEDTLRKNLHEVLKDDTYKNKAQEMSKRFKDRPMPALDTAMYWIEYVIRNKGADFIKNPAHELSWFANNMLDVFAFLLLSFIVSAYVVFIVVRALIIIAQSSSTNKSKKIKTK
ncbi:UDP-glucuronosyltransferase 2B20-like [Ostrinia furnacalis]|uniref:UDP-glucuronosyltransferase 2B20-like n=1 Tax=Ostrinia furnacalis TaxID=93504 RepID=UPI00103C4454|nr:UDP-glucuronosyltransferase 2B20-like [Ostrinia furnacalis]